MSQAEPKSTQPHVAPIALETLSRADLPEAGALDTNIMKSNDTLYTTGLPATVEGTSNGAFVSDSEAPASKPPADPDAIRERHDPDPVMTQTQRGAMGARGNGAAVAQGTGHQEKSEKEMLTTILVDSRGSPGSNKVAPDEKPPRPNGVYLLQAHTNTSYSMLILLVQYKLRLLW